MQSSILCSGALCSSGMEYVGTCRVKIHSIGQITDQNSHHHLLEAQQLGPVHDGEGEAAGEQRDAEEDQHGPEVADLKQTEGSQIELQTNHWQNFYNHREGPK